MVAPLVEVVNEVPAEDQISIEEHDIHGEEVTEEEETVVEEEIVPEYEEGVEGLVETEMVSIDEDGDEIYAPEEEVEEVFVNEVSQWIY